MDSVLRSNTAGSGAGLCYPVRQPLALCGDLISSLSGDIGPVKRGQMLPFVINCSWTVGQDTLPLKDDCAMELEFHEITLEQTVDVVTVFDLGTGSQVFFADLSVRSSDLPPTFRSRRARKITSSVFVRAARLLSLSRMFMCCVLSVLMMGFCPPASLPQRPQGVSDHFHRPADARQLLGHRRARACLSFSHLVLQRVT